MDYILKDIIKYHINDYLCFKDKIILSLINKKFNKIQKSVIHFHLGEIIAKKLGIKANSLDEDLEILRSYNFEFLNEIKNICFKEKDYIKKFNILILPGVKFGNLIKINNATLIECKDLILKNKFKYSSHYTVKLCNSNYYQQNFHSCYSLLY